MVKYPKLAAAPRTAIPTRAPTFLYEAERQSVIPFLAEERKALGVLKACTQQRVAQLAEVVLIGLYDAEHVDHVFGQADPPFAAQVGVKKEITLRRVANPNCKAERRHHEIATVRPMLQVQRFSGQFL
jgi:hypothetical protein